MEDYARIDDDNTENEFIDPVNQFEHEEEGIFEHIDFNPMSIWKNHKNYIIYIIIAIMVLIGLYFGWKYYKNRGIQTPNFYYLSR